MKNVTRILVILLALASLVSMAVAQSRNGRNVVGMNYQTGIRISTQGINGLTKAADVQPGLAMSIAEAAGTQSWRGNLRVKQSFTVKAGTEFVNTGLDRRGIPVQWKDKAKRDRTAHLIECVTTGLTFVVLDECLNVGARIAAIPWVNQQLTEVSNSTEVDFDVSLSVNIDFKPSVVANATASTAPINITINNTTAGAPLMNMGGGSGANQFIVTRDSRGLFSLGYTVGGGTKISICNVNNNVNLNNNENNNTNNNSNSNSNSNSNNVNIGGGELSPEPLLAYADVGDYVESLFQADANRPREHIAA